MITFKDIPKPLLENLVAAYDYENEASKNFLKELNSKVKNRTAKTMEYASNILTTAVKDIYHFIKYPSLNKTENTKHKMMRVPQELLESLFDSIELSKEKWDKYHEFKGDKKEKKLIEEEYDMASENENRALRDIYIFLKYTAQIEPIFNNDLLTKFGDI